MPNSTGTGYTNGSGGYYIPKGYTAPSTTPRRGMAAAAAMTPEQRLAQARATANYYNADPVRGALSNPIGTDQRLMSIGGNYQMPTLPSLPNRPGSGGSGGGGGGGGGGAGGLTAEQQAALLRLAQHPALMQFQQYQAPQYQQYQPTAMDMGIFDAARGRINTAAEADRTRANQAYDPLLGQLQSAQNPMSNATWATTPQLQQAYQRIIGNTNPLPQIAQENAYSMNSDNAFGNLMAILTAQEDRNKQSRIAEAMQARAGALGGIDALSSGMLGGVEMNQLSAAEQDRIRRDDIAREEARYGYDQTAAQAYANWQAQQQVDQGNVGIKNNTIQQLLQLIPGITQKDLLAALAVPA